MLKTLILKRRRGGREEKVSPAIGGRESHCEVEAEQTGTLDFREDAEGRLFERQNLPKSPSQCSLSVMGDRGS